MAQCSLLELNETREGKRTREFSFEYFLRQSPLKSSIHAGKLLQQLRFAGRSETIAFLEIIRLVQVERSKGRLSSRQLYDAETKLHSEW